MGIINKITKNTANKSRSNVSIMLCASKMMASALVIILAWQLCITLFHLPSYLLPTPLHVFKTLLHFHKLLWHHTAITFIETIIGLFCGAVFGIFSALFMTYYSRLHGFVFPFLLISQIIPVFAIAPILVLWFGFGISAKLLIVTLITFFPITANFYDGLRHTPNDYLDIAILSRTARWRTLRTIKLPHALPRLATGLRIATIYAPVGAIISEWVGANQGLGYLMLNANANLQMNIVFAALVMLVIMTLILYYVINWSLKRWIWW